tara:strand:+ start:236 stop:481 length:246 start_codon:yes stop_codon:yes gene_type:complete
MCPHIELGIERGSSLKEITDMLRSAMITSYRYITSKMLKVVSLDKDSSGCPTNQTRHGDDSKVHKYYHYYLKHSISSLVVV